MFRWMRYNWKNIISVIKPYGRVFLGLIIIELISMFFSVLAPLLNMKLINMFVYEKMSIRHLMYVYIYVTFLACTGVIGYIGSVKKRSVNLKMEEELKSKIIRHALRKEQQSYDINELGELDASIKMDASIFQQFVIKYVLDYPFLVLRLICVVIVLCVQCYEVAIVLGVAQTIVCIFQRLVYKKLEEQSESVRTEYANVNEITSDIVGKVAYIESIGAERYVFYRFKKYYERYISKAVWQVKSSTKISLLIEFIINLNLLVVLGIGSYKIYNKELTVGALLSIIQYMGLFLGAFSLLSRYQVDMHTESKSINNVLMILKNENKNQKCDHDENNDIIKKIVLEDVSFEYTAGNVILNGANARFDRGRLNCIMGPSGAGKSTLLKLMLGKYSLNGGEINVITKKGKNRLKKEQVSFVPQENVFFTDTIYNNLVLGKKIEEEYVYKVCKECSIYDDILSLENGFDTVISNGIINLSGGQIKRLSIARAIIQNKSILLVDEPTVGLDRENVNNVVECIMKYAKEKIVVVITHDDAIEKKAEKVYLISNKLLI